MKAAPVRCCWRIDFPSSKGNGFVLLLGSAPRHLQGSASGFLAMARTMGQSVSVALAGAIFAGLGGAAAGTSWSPIPPVFNSLK